MKKRNLILALIAFIGIFAISCSNDDNEGETLAPIQGKWLKSQQGIIVNGEEQLTDVGENPGCDRDYMDLRASNVVVFGTFNSLDGSCDETVLEGVYARSHNNLTTTVGGVSTTQDIVNLTVDELKVKDNLGVITVYKR
ncbi:lipocalin family protein [Flavobacterium agrisoli]|uniref:Lipocalin family protein n=1 Tax=Flavobacterium agrisoli TaxID=2793066 RepID=A0A934PM04_9FLAO|nr:lipocalin family protein [Flavobacterium agrisoli]MBK0368931.1 lipocalin family protein [Flavobacterium agrisoli]